MDMTTAIILILIGGAIGFLVGLLLLSLRGKSSPTKEEKVSASKDWKELAHLGRQISDRRFTVRLDGKSYLDVKELTDDQNYRLIEVSNDFRKWLQIPQVPGTSKLDQPLNSAPSGMTSFEKKPLSPPADVEKSTKFTTGQSIVAQIDAILQMKLQGTPYASQGIRLMEVPGQGMMVVVGLNKYQDINDVPDGQIRKMIQEAVADWEKQAST
jgi:gas vesicle protein